MHFSLYDLFFSQKSNGNYDDGMYKSTCFLIQKSFISPKVRKFLGSKAWKRTVYWDEVLHKAANTALDLTIEKLGREAFQHQLNHFRQVQTELVDACSGKVIFPCNSKGERIPPNKTDCLQGDNGCGFDCMNTYFNLLNENLTPLRIS